MKIISMNIFIWKCEMSLQKKINKKIAKIENYSKYWFYFYDMF